MARCMLCKTPDGFRDVEAYEACEIEKGGPCLPCQQYIKLETKILAMKETLDRLLIDRLNLLTEINHRHDPIIHRLPPELTAKIFEAYVDNDYGFQESGRERKTTCSPFLLGAVCRTWRHIAWSAPTLWTRICISTSEPETSEAAEHVQIYHEWLNRSGQLPLSISFICPDIEYKEDLPRVYRRLILMVNQHSTRWKDLRIQCWPELLKLFRGDSQGVPLLRKLCLTLEENDPHDAYRVRSNAQGTKPRPSHVELHRIRFKSVDVNWNNVTYANFQGFSIHLDECIDLLRQAPQLRNCRISAVCLPKRTAWQLEEIVSKQPIAHHGLQQLSFGGYAGRNLGLVLRVFTFPNLTHLELHAIADASLWSYIIDLHTRSSMRLENLDIGVGIHCDYETLIKIFEKTPFLSELLIPTENTLPADALDFFRFLTITSTFDSSDNFRNSFLPNLRSIEYNPHFISWDASFWELIPRLFGQRLADIPKTRTGRRPLKKVSIRSYVSEGPKICLDRNVVLCLVELSRSGVIFDLSNHGMDLLEESKHHHGIRIG